MARISSKNQVTIPATVLEEAKLHAGAQVSIEGIGDGKLRVRGVGSGFEDAFGALANVYPEGYLARLDRADEHR